MEPTPRQRQLSLEVVIVVKLLLLFTFVVGYLADERGKIHFPPGGGLEGDLKEVQKICGLHQRRNSSRASHRIAAGYEAKPGEFPSYARVYIAQGSRLSDCGGTIISERFILTAAHCLVTNFHLTSIKVGIGSVSAESDIILEAEAYCLPDGYNNFYSRLDIDLAVVVMKRAIYFNEFVQPACLPNSDADARQQAWTVGFGDTGPNTTDRQTRPGPDTLQVLPMRRQPACKFSGKKISCWRANQTNKTGQICQGKSLLLSEFTGHDDKHLANAPRPISSAHQLAGDSGGPIYTVVNGRQTLVGVATGSSGDCELGINGLSVYTNIFPLRSKINRYAKRCRRL